VKRIRKRGRRQFVPAGSGYFYYRRNFGTEAQDYRVRTTISTETKEGHSHRKTARFKEKPRRTRRRGPPLGAAKDDEADLGRNAEADGSADGAQAAIHVEVGHGRRGKARSEGLNA